MSFTIQIKNVDIDKFGGRTFDGRIGYSSEVVGWFESYDDAERAEELLEQGETVLATAQLKPITEGTFDDGFRGCVLNVLEESDHVKYLLNKIDKCPCGCGGINK